MPYKVRVTPERLRELLSYDPETGVFRYRHNRKGGMKAGQRAGTENDGRWQICVDGIVYKAHRLAWLYMTGEWPNPECDHKDTNPLNNRWDNLREATRSQNAANTRRLRTSSSGFKGVSRGKQTGTWRATIRVNYKIISLGQFSTPEAAHAAYVEAALRYFGEFARAA